MIFKIIKNCETKTTIAMSGHLGTQVLQLAKGGIAQH